MSILKLYYFNDSSATNYLDLVLLFVIKKTFLLLDECYKILFKHSIDPGISCSPDHSTPSQSNKKCWYFSKISSKFVLNNY
jgi:hypothetical protein